MCNISRNINSLVEVGSSIQVFCILTEFVSNYTINYHEKNKICSCKCEFLYIPLCSVSFCFMYFEALLLDLVQIIIIIIITRLWNMLVIIVIL